MHTDDLAQMTWLAATHPAARQRFLAVDRNVMLGEYFVPLMAALGQPVTAPPLEPVRSRCRIGKTRTVLGTARSAASSTPSSSC